MVGETEVRRSGRRTIRPVEYWNFEKPEDVISDKIIYKLSDLTRCSIYDEMSTKYCHEVSSALSQSSKKKTTVSRISKSAHVTNSHGRVRHRGKLKASSISALSKSQSTIPKKTTHKAGSNLNEKDIHHPVVQEHISSKSEKEKKQVHELQEEANNKNFSSEISTLESDWLPYNPRGQRDIPRLDLLTLKNSSINGTQDQTTFEQPSFQNIISSTFINTHSISHQGKHAAVTVPVQHMSENINSGIFKVPRLPSNTLAVKNSTINLLSMASIPEESSLLEATESEVPSQVCPSKENPLTNTLNQTILNPPRSSVHSQTHCNAHIEKAIQAAHSGPPSNTRKEIHNQVHCKRDIKETLEDNHSAIAVTATQDPSINKTTNNNESVSLRRSGRVRTKPLEFWNFEKITVTTLENGKTNVVHQKQELPSINRKKQQPHKDQSHHPAVAPARHPPQESTLEILVLKRKLFSPTSNSLDETADISDNQPLKRQRNLGTTDESPDPETIKVMKFSDLNFGTSLTRNCKCHFARSFEDKNRNIYTGFVFLERGQLVWDVTKETKLYVIDGCGTLQSINKAAQGTAIRLQTATSLTITSGPNDAGFVMEDLYYVV
ncbi:uncharacterized protein [Cherax quadricarinatus]|uniref:uncharacterized protein isoform X2 n=1 Tax=Cherax quadricarinatus TaxID=27406 RepID=UPI00387E906A